jgi:hypothetical protein
VGHRDFKPETIFITKKRVYKIGIYYYFFLLIGDYGISCPIEITTTMAAGTGYEG